MALTLQGIKQTLTLLGVRDLTVRFDPTAKNILVDFTYGGRQRQKQIQFSDIEAAFSDSDLRPSVAPQAAENG